MKRWIVIANCQAAGLANSIASLAREVECHMCYLDEFQRRMREEPSWFRDNFDFAIVYDDAYAWHRFAADDLPPHIMLPNFSFGAFHPDCCYVKIDDVEAVEGIVGPYHSMVALAAYKEGLSAERAVTFFNETVYRQAGFFDLWESQRDRIVTRYARAGVAIGPAMRRLSQGRSFMLTVNHPKIEILFEAARAILAARDEPMFEGSWPPPETLAHVQWPIYPEVGRHLGLPGAYVFKPLNDWRPIGLEAFLSRSLDVFSAWDKARLKVDPSIRPRLWRIREMMREAI